MIIDKEKYLKDEARQLELSRDGGLFEVDTNYMTGYREGLKTGYIEATRNLEEIIKASKVIQVIDWNFKSINEMASQYATANTQISKLTAMLEQITKSDNETIKGYKGIVDYYLSQWQELSDKLEEEKEKIQDLEETILSLDYNIDFVYLPYEIDIEDEKITLNEALEVLKKSEPTDELIDSYIRDYKNELGIYIDLGEEEDKRISSEIYNQIEKERIKNINFIQNELKEIYKTRADASESQAVEV